MSKPMLRPGEIKIVTQKNKTIGIYSLREDGCFEVGYMDSEDGLLINVTDTKKQAVDWIKAKKQTSQVYQELKNNSRRKQ